MKTKTLLITITGFILMSSCNQTTEASLNLSSPEDLNKDTTTVGLRPDTINAPHYILSFIQPKSFTAQALSDGGKIWIYFDAKHHFGYGDGSDQKLYSDLCELYGDVTYNRQRIFPAAEDKGFAYLANNIVSINVIAETNYDEEYPAGSSLNKICVLEGESPYPHIKSGYTLTHDWPMANGWQPDKGSIPFSKPLTECTAEDMILMGDGVYSLCKIKLKKMPTAGSKQLLTIKLEDETGRVYTVTTEPFTW